MLQAMLEDIDKAPELFKPTQFWNAAIPAILRDLRELGWANFRAHPSALDM